MRGPYNSDSIGLFLYFGHNFFNLTPIRPPFEHTRPSLPPLQDYEKNGPYLDVFLTDFGDFRRRIATPTMLVLPRFSFDFLPSSCEISSSFLAKFPLLSQEKLLLLEWLKSHTFWNDLGWNSWPLFIDFSNQSHDATCLNIGHVFQRLKAIFEWDFKSKGGIKSLLKSKAILN